MVLVRHMPQCADISGTLLESVVAWGKEIGWIGVDLFFVMSGFLISTLIYQEFDATGNFKGKRFLIRRAFKIWPVYFIGYWGVTSLRILSASAKSETEKVRQLLIDGGWNSVFLQNYVHCERWTHSWTIAIEEHFYTVFALLAFLAVSLTRKSSQSGKEQFRFLIPLFLVTATLVLAMRCYLSIPDYNWHRVYYPTHLRIDSLLFGVLLGYFHQYHRPSIPAWITSWPMILGSLVVAGTLPAIWPLENSLMCGTIGFTVLYLCCGVLVLAAMKQPDVGRNSRLFGPICKFVAAIGVYSYTIYLSHSFLPMTPGFEYMRSFTTQVAMHKFGNVVAVWYDRMAFIGASIILGIILSHLIERPFLKLRSKWAPSHHADQQRDSATRADVSTATLSA